MATEAEHEILRLALENNLRPADVDTTEDQVFADLVVDYVLSRLNFKNESQLDEIIIWLTEDYCRERVKKLLTDFRDRALDREVEAFAKRLFLKLTEPETRLLVIDIFHEKLKLSDDDFSREEKIQLIINRRNTWSMKGFLENEGFDANIAAALLHETGALNEFPDAMREQVASFVGTKAFSNVVLKNSWEPARDARLLPLVGKKTVIKRLDSLSTPEEFEEMLKALKDCREELRILGEELEEAAANGKPAPGRPDAKALEDFKDLKVKARKSPSYYEDDLKYMEADILAYELTLEAQEKALARALKAEADGTVRDPLKVSEIEGTIASVKAHIRMKAIKKFLKKLKEDAS